MKAFLSIFLLLFSFKASSYASFDLQQAANNATEATDLSEKISSFMLIHGFVEQIKGILSTPEAKEDFYKIRKVVEDNRNKDFLTCFIQKYCYGYDPEQAKSETEKITMLLDYQIRQHPEKEEQLLRVKRLWLGMEINLVILTGFKVKALGQTSQEVFDMFLSDFIQLFLTAETLDKFLNQGINSLMLLLPIVKDIQFHGDSLQKIEEKLGLASTASIQYAKMRDAIESYLPQRKKINESKTEM